MALLFCAVCGRGSTRPAWNNQVGALVFCDFHSQDEINYAVINATTPAPNIVVDNPATDVAPQV